MTKSRSSPPAKESPPGPGWNVSFNQWTWLGLGLTVLILVSIIASPNLREIYNSQKDFVVGALFSMVGFFLGKAFSRTQEQKAVELIRDHPPGRVAEVLSTEIKRALHDRGAFEDVARLDRNVEVAAGRLLKYFDSQAQKLEFYQGSADLIVALDDLDQAAADLARLRGRLAGPDVTPSTSNELSGPALVSVNRSVTAANDRGKELYEWLKLQAADAIGEDAWAVFGVLAYDTRKAERALGILRSGRGNGYTDEYLAEVAGYLTAGLDRATIFRGLAADRSVKMPELFNIMIGDMRAARNGVGRLMSDGRLLASLPEQTTSEPEPAVPA